VPGNKLQRYLYDFPGRGAKQFSNKKPVPYQYLITGNMSITRKAAEIAGDFCEDFEGYGGEDTLYSYRIWKIFPGGIKYSSTAVAYDQHIYNLDEMLIKYKHYGEQNLPRLIKLHPTMLYPLRANYIMVKSVKNKLIGFMFNPVFYFIAQILFRISPYPLSNHLIRYLLLGAIREGYLEGLRQQKG